MKKMKFIGTIYILHDVLPVLSQLSNRFQRGNVNFSHLLPAIKATHAELNRLKEDKESLKKLQNDLAQIGRLHRCGLTLSDNKMQELCSLMNRFIVALQDNINNRFEPTLPLVSAFSIFDIADLPNESDPRFEDYGQAEIKIISNHFYGTKEEEEKKMNRMKEALKIPTFSQQQTGPYKGCLRGARPTRIPIQTELLMVAEAAWTMPLSNCWPERGGSAIKRIKTRMRSRLTDDMLNALMHVSINGPSFGTEECTDIVQRAAEIWLSAKNRRKPRLPKESKMPEVESVSDTRASEGERLSGNESQEAVDEFEVDEVDADARTEEEVEIATAALGLCEVDCDTDSDDSAFGSDLDE
ncbi:Zinc finger protein 862 [Stylophora pistillata]|uniref:Zinc finger protein 862 n=1 Tax=Stylophora pistillata TaxID=50429 RepID=A0A2B4R5V8_STYPI|nr:Zinc finger protein 862 [Stylophora pistillata]